MDHHQLTAPCGLDCYNCEIYEGNLTSAFSKFIHEKLDIPIDEIPCKGCRMQDGNHYHLPAGGCETLNCVKSRGVELCCECDEFPCNYLAPIADQADRYPHNMKLYNLCRIKKAGLEHWIKNEARQVRHKYFKGKFVVGKGQTD